MSPHRQPKPRGTLTPRQAEFLAALERLASDIGYPPTLRELGEALGIRSTNGVADYLRALERKGYLRRESLKSRAIVLTGKEPVVG